VKQLSVSGYAEADVRAALTSSRRTFGFRYERYDKSNVLQGAFNNVIGGSVDHGAFADIVGTAKFAMKDTGGIDWTSDRCKPIVRLRMNDGGYAEWPMGLFLLSSPALTSQRAVWKNREIDAYDQSFILISDKVTARFFVAAGAL